MLQLQSLEWGSIVSTKMHPGTLKNQRGEIVKSPWELAQSLTLFEFFPSEALAAVTSSFGLL